MKILLNSLLVIAAAVIFANAGNAQQTIEKDGITISPAKKISLDEIGLLEDKDGGFGFDMWDDSDGKFIKFLIETLPIDMKSVAANNLKKRLLLTIAAPPSDNGQAVPIVEQRLKHLALMGDGASIRKLILLIPTDLLTEQINKIYASSLFIGLMTSDACDLVQKSMSNSNDFFWRKSFIACQFLQGQKAEADISIKLLNEEKIEVPDSFTEVIKAFKELPKAEAEAKWYKLLKDEILAMPYDYDLFPSLKAIQNSSLSKEKTISWLDKAKDLPEQEKLYKVAKFYQILAALGEEVPENEWQELFAFAIMKNTPVPFAVSSVLINKSIDHSRNGEAVLLILHAIGSNPPKEIAADNIAEIIEALRVLGFDKEASMLAEESIFAE